MIVFLKLKHWVLFLVLILTSYISVNYMFELIDFNQTEIISNVLAIINLLFFYGWLWSIVIVLKSEVPKKDTILIKKFIFFFCITVVLSIIITTSLEVIIDKIIKQIDSQSTSPITKGLNALVAMPFLIRLYVIFYSVLTLFFLITIYFTSKILKTIELNEKVKFRQFISYFLLMLFYPIGIWFIQPKLNLLVTKKITNDSC